MLVIRLQRIGKKHQASFRIALQDRRWKPKGKVLELLGFYDPHSKAKKFQDERIKFWVAQGAQPSATVHNMLIDAGIITGEKVKAWRPKKSKKGEAVPAKAAEVKTKTEKAEKDKAVESQPVEPKEKPAVDPSEQPSEQPAAAEPGDVAIPSEVSV